MSTREDIARAIEQLARDEWDRILLRRDFRPGETRNAGSSYWDGRQSAFREAARIVRETGAVMVVALLAPDPPPHCERVLTTEGPCYGPRYPPDHRATADKVLEGRRLCDNHILALYGPEVYYGPRDPRTRYRISPHGFYDGPVAVGQSVYVLFCPPQGEGGAEGMWVTVTRIEGATVTGKLDNSPLDSALLQIEYGDTVVFPRTAIRKVLPLRPPLNGGGSTHV
jgi:hypothetical protein